VVQADEEDDEEPYLMVAVIYADGTTIDISHPGTSTIRMDHTHQTHGNVPTPYDDLGSGDTVALGFSWERSILPVGLQFADLGAVSDTTLTTNTNVYILVVAMEEDALNTSAVTAGWSAACNVLQSELNQIAQTLDLATALNGGPDIDMAALQQKVQDAAEKTTKAKIMTGDIFPLDDAVDPDDFVGWGIYRISYETLRNSKSFYNPYYHTKLWYAHEFTMDLHNTDSGVHYQVSGQVIRTEDYDRVLASLANDRRSGLSPDDRQRILDRAQLR